MPVWLRKFYIRTLIETRTEENKAKENPKSRSKVAKPSIIKRK